MVNEVTAPVALKKYRSVPVVLFITMFVVPAVVVDICPALAEAATAPTSTTTTFMATTTATK